METLAVEIVFARIARSGLPSPLKSPTASEVGKFPTVISLRMKAGAVCVAERCASMTSVEIVKTTKRQAWRIITPSPGRQVRTQLRRETSQRGDEVAATRFPN